VIKADGTRCRATRTLRTGACPGHSGIGGVAANPAASSQLGHAEKRRRSLARAQLGITARRAATPLQAARLAAQLRADDYARALVDAPLDDPDLSTLQRQRAAIDAVNVLFPPSTVQLQVEVPEDAAGVEGLSWAEMQSLAAQLLGSQE